MVILQLLELQLHAAAQLGDIVFAEVPASWKRSFEKDQASSSC